MSIPPSPDNPAAVSVELARNNVELLLPEKLIEARKDLLATFEEGRLYDPPQPSRDGRGIPQSSGTLQRVSRNVDGTLFVSPEKVARYFQREELNDCTCGRPHTHVPYILPISPPLPNLPPFSAEELKEVSSAVSGGQSAAPQHHQQQQQQQQQGEKLAQHQAVYGRDAIGGGSDGGKLTDPSPHVFNHRLPDARKRMPIIKYMHAKTKHGKPSRKNVILMQERVQPQSRTSVHVYEMLKSSLAPGLYGTYYRWPLTPIHTFAIASVLILF